MSEFLNKTGVPIIENTIFRRLQNKYFLYGREVDDFKQLDNDYLNAISIKGIQDLFKKNCSLENKLMNLCNQLNIDFNTL